MARLSSSTLLLAVPLVLWACQGDKDGDGGPTDDSPPTDGDTDTETGDTDTGDPPVPTGETGITTEGPEELCSVVVDCVGGIQDDPKTPCDLTVTHADGTVQYTGTAGLELRGRSSLYFPKQQYAVELREHHELALWPGSTWTYLGDGSDPGTAWRDAAFDDSAWSSGLAPFGYGFKWLATQVDPTPTTTYYRRDFTIYDLAATTDVELGIKVDDGSAVYVNGIEVLRDNLPVGATYDTLANSVRGLGEYLQVDIPIGLIVKGDNTIAVEVHKGDALDAEMRFDLYVEATGPDAAENLLGMGKEEDWILNGQYVDRVLWRNRLAYDLYQTFGGLERYAPESRFCELVLDGKPRGIYTLGEKIKRDDDRVDIVDGTNPGDSFIVKLDDEYGFHDNAIGYGEWQLVYPRSGEGAEPLVSAALSDIEAAVLGPDPADPVTGIFGEIDLDSAVDWVLLNEFFKNADAYLLSIHMWKDEGGKVFFAPWDLDLSLGSYPYTDCGPEGWNYRHGNLLIEEMADVPEFQTALQARWAQLRKTEFSEKAILARIAAYDATLAPALDDELALWPVEDVEFGFGGIDQWLCPVASYTEEHANVLAFISARLAWMDDNIDTF